MRFSNRHAQVIVFSIGLIAAIRAEAQTQPLPGSPGSPGTPGYFVVTGSYLKPVACQSASTTSPMCLHPAMPLYQQNDPGLLQYVNTQLHSNIAYDPGWCTPTAAAMYGKAISNENMTAVRTWASASAPASYASMLTSVINSLVASASHTFYDGLSEYPAIYQTMLAVKTNITSGGTYDSNSVPFAIGDAGKAGGGATTGTGALSNIPLITQHNPLGFVNEVCSSGGHSLAINGYEGKWDKIYDPWGAVYSVNPPVLPRLALTFAGLPGEWGGEIAGACQGSAPVTSVVFVYDYVHVPVIQFVPPTTGTGTAGN